jgi:hypothetical protein
MRTTDKARFEDKVTAVRTARRESILMALATMGTIMALLAAACPAHAQGEYAFVLTTDYYSAAYYTTIETTSPRTVDVSIASVNTDAVAHYDLNENMVFVINRYLADNIQLVDPDSAFATTGQYSVGNGSNPHDIRLESSGKAYVSRYEWKTLLICDPYTGDSLGVIDLSSFADADGIPEMDHMEIVDGKLFVTLNLIDRSTWLPAGPGKIAVVDVAADTLIDADPMAPGTQPIALSCPNPYTELRYDPCRGELVVGCLGSWGVADGGIEIIDPFTLESKGTVATELGLGGDISDAILGPGAKGYAVLMDLAPWPDNYARLVSFDRATGTVMDTLFIQESGMGSSLAGIELSRQRELYLCDRDATQPGVRIYDALMDTLITIADVGLPPFDIAFVEQPHAGTPYAPAEPDMVEDIPAVAIAGYPNPARDKATIRLDMAGEVDPGPISVRIFDVAGRHVRTLDIAGARAGSYEVEWDGRDRNGELVASGVYYCRTSGEGKATARIVLLR